MDAADGFCAEIDSLLHRPADGGPEADDAADDAADADDAAKDPGPNKVAAADSAADNPAEAAGRSSRMSIGKAPPDMRQGGTAETTSRKVDPKKAEKKKKSRIGKGKRVKVKKKHLLNSISHDDENKEAYDLVAKFVRDDRNFYGTVVSSGGSGIYNIKFDDLPCDKNTFKIARKSINVVEPDEEQKEYDREEEEMVEKCSGEKPSRSKASKESTKSFCKQSTEQLKSAKSFRHSYASGPNDHIVWTILGDDEQITEDAMDSASTSKADPFKTDIPWDPNVNEVDYNKILFEHFLPSVEGKAKQLDKWLSSPSCPMHGVMQNDNIKFHREGDEDPDALVSHRNPINGSLLTLCRSPRTAGQALFNCDDRRNTQG